MHGQTHRRAKGLPRSIRKCRCCTSHSTELLRSLSEHVGGFPPLFARSTRSIFHFLFSSSSTSFSYFSLFYDFHCIIASPSITHLLSSIEQHATNHVLSFNQLSCAISNQSSFADVVVFFCKGNELSPFRTSSDLTSGQHRSRLSAPLIHN